LKFSFYDQTGRSYKILNLIYLHINSDQIQTFAPTRQTIKP